ncbi:uncharacterized protein LOC111781052 [Cucurbita pepo subsp. pepo]|uniref:uncharacterized protein LOC111781052 n=1 Tax=Cucurbita pepo subsp. pepo TaxID=3664 RepID=UPI000C9D8290|nr:uncharacterized protein LOC111781052 [Cucurbita pepo subsp. pepo]
MAGGGNGGGGRGSFLKKAARKIFVATYACRSSSRRKSRSVSNLSASSAQKPKHAVEAVGEAEIAEQIESRTSNNLPSKNLCPICLDPLIYKTEGCRPGQAIFTAQCSHAFHFSCISSNVRHGSVTCPICRDQWTQLPRNSVPLCTQIDPILRILDDSISTSRINRRSFLLSSHYDDDDRVELDRTPTHHSRLSFSLHLATSSFCPPIQVSGCAPCYLCYNRLTRPPLPLPQQFPCRSPSPLLQPPRITAKPRNRTRAYLSVKLAHQRATDLVLVVCSNGPHLRLLKQAMALVISSLHSIDCLAIVIYSSSATGVFPLRRMTSYGKRAALQVIDHLFYMGQADAVVGLQKAIKILEDSTHKNPNSSVLHLSDSRIQPYRLINLESPTVPIHWFHVGLGFRTSPGFVMQEFEEFLMTKVFRGIIRDIQLKIVEESSRSTIINIAELRGDEEKIIVIDNLLSDNEGHVRVRYSYVDGEISGEECMKAGETLLSLGIKSNNDVTFNEAGRENREEDASLSRRISSVERWDHHDPFGARRWSKHLHSYRL